MKNLLLSFAFTHLSPFVYDFHVKTIKFGLIYLFLPIDEFFAIDKLVVSFETVKKNNFKLCMIY